MLRHFAGLAEIVDDMDAAIAFYRDVLGMDVEVKQEGRYALAHVAGVLHFGIWDRRHAAQCTLGSPDLADQIPLGYTVEFEVDDLEEAATHIQSQGCELAHGPRTEPWGQQSMRMMSPGGAVLGFAVTPWGRRLSQHLEVGEDE